MSKYKVFSGLYFPVFVLNTEYSYLKYSKNNSVFGHFSRSVIEQTKFTFSFLGKTLERKTQKQVDGGIFP